MSYSLKQHGCAALFGGACGLLLSVLLGVAGVCTFFWLRPAVKTSVSKSMSSQQRQSKNVSNDRTIPSHDANPVAVPVLPETTIRESSSPVAVPFTFAAIDKHALAAPADAEQSIEELAQYLIMPAKTDEEKARAIFRWITDRIAYDVEGLLSGNLGDTSALATLKRRKSVCQGYATLFEALSTHAGLQVVTITGEAKGVVLPNLPNANGHAWNAVRVNGQWKLLDATWAAGTADVGKRKFNKRYNELFFFTDPHQLIFSHLPADSQWQLLEQPVSKAQFRRWPRIETDLFRLGISLDDLRHLCDQQQPPEVVKVYTFPDVNLKIVQAPLTRLIPSTQPLHVVLKSPSIKSVAFWQGRQSRIYPWMTTFSKHGETFDGEITPTAERILVGIELLDKPGDYSFVLEYKVMGK